MMKTTIYLLTLSGLLLGASAQQPTGTLMFRTTFKQPVCTTDKPHSQTLVNVDGVFDLELRTDASAVSIASRWDNAITNAMTLNCVLPELPAGDLHVAFTWNSQKPEINLFLNGIPCAFEGVADTWRGTQWIMPQRAPETRPGDFPIKEVEVLDRMITKAELRKLVRETDRQNLAPAMGALASQPMNIEPLKGELLYESDFQTGNWIIEGPGTTAFEDDALAMRSTRPDDAPPAEGHFVRWLDRDFPEDFVAEWEFQVRETGLAIVFFSATGINGKDLFDPTLKPRTGRFAQYVKSDVDCYHISYFANVRTQLNLRKNSGSYLVKNGPAQILPTDRDWRRIALVKNDGRIQLAIDGQCVIDYTDGGKTCGPVLGGGKLGFRQMAPTVAAYRNLRVYGINR